ncbi:pyridoxal phosphate-dependent transferase [Pavlovales sp. CCMP2436]|nr:pyridoxal phosphate-dependent transferase [Pavlovales sp. CCMP2436]
MVEGELLEAGMQATQTSETARADAAVAEAAALRVAAAASLARIEQLEASAGRLLPPISATALAAAPAAIEEVYRSYWRPGMHNLAPGLPYWPPPSATRSVLAEAATAEAFGGRELHCYADVRGHPSLLDAIGRKLLRENRVPPEGRRLVVTTGANQAFVSTLMATCAPGDAALVFAPYYFTHVVAMQLLGIRPHVVSCDPETLLPDPAAVARAVTAEGGRLRALVLTSPGNPSGAVIPERMLRALVDEAVRLGLWVISDEAYEHFVFDGAAHYSPAADVRARDNVLCLFTMSKSYGMAGWRVGYVSYPERLDEVMLKIQDTVPTHATTLAQQLAAAALDEGADWVRARVASLEPTRAALWAVVRETLELTGAHSVRGTGALYAFVRLPVGVSDEEAVRVLADAHSVLVLPGSSAGMAGHLRISFASVEPGSEAATAALGALRAGLDAIAASSRRVGGL